MFEVFNSPLKASALLPLSGTFFYSFHSGSPNLKYSHFRERPSLILILFSTAAIAKYPRQGDLKNRNSFPHISGDWTSRCLDCFEAHSPWLVDGCLLQMSSHTLFPVSDFYPNL